jgi:DNA-binding LacI/PurR family transcriptional regulator
MAACRDAGLSIPEDISFINYGDCSTMAFAYPPVTCVDLNMSEQVSTAFKMLDGKIKDNLRLVKPTFFERKSIRVI